MADLRAPTATPYQAGVPFLAGGPVMTNPSGTAYMPFAPALDEVALLSEDATLFLKAKLGPGSPAIDPATYGGWEQVALPGQRARPVWRGVGAPVLGVSLLLDGFIGAKREPIEGAYETLERMAGFTSGFVEPKPPRLIVNGPAIPHNSSRNPRYRWLLSELVPTDEPPVIRSRDSGLRLRQAVTIVLMLDNRAEELERIKPRKSKPRSATIRSKAGDTYRKIAARRFGDARLGRKLAKLNGDRDPSKVLTTGSKVKVPGPTLLAEWRRDLKRGR